jgi:hypothetical protein
VHVYSDSRNGGETGDNLKMPRILVMPFILLSAFFVAGCNRNSEIRTPLPTATAAVTTPFLDAVRRGDQRTAEKYLAPDFIDDSGSQFAKMSAILKDAPPLVSAIYQSGAEGQFIVFVAKDKNKWVSSEMRLGRINGKQVIQYWDVKSDNNPPAILAHVQTMKNVVNYGLIAVGFALLAAIALIIWAVRNRTSRVASRSPTETRQPAATVRNTEN